MLRGLSPSGLTTRFVVAVAFAGALSAACDVHTPTGPGTLASITVTPNVTLAINATQQFIAVGKDADGNVVALTPTWSVVAGGGAIDNAGLFTAGTTPGTFTNTVQATSGSISGHATVVVIAGPLATITVTPNPDTLPITGTQQYTAVGKDAGGNVVPITPTWSVVASGGTIGSTGLFTAGTTPGTYTNTVQATSGSISSRATVVVTTGALATIVVTPTPVTLPITGTQQYTAVGKDAGGNVVAIAPTWSVAASGGTITSSGLFTAGTALGTFASTVTATVGAVAGTASVTVIAGPLATITVTPNPDTLAISGTQTFTAVGKDAGGNVVAIAPTWSVVASMAAAGTINSSSGQFTAGTAPATYTGAVQAASGSISGFATVTVIAGPLATITVSPNPVTLAITGTQTFTAVGKDASGNVVTITPTWTVVAGGGAITSAGLFTAGTVPGTFANTVEATSGSISGTATVTVTSGALATITVTPNPDTLAISGTQTFTAVGKDAGGNVVPITPTWSVVAGGGTIGSTGLFTAGTTPGTYTNTVQATSGSISGHATVVVIAGPLATVVVTPTPVTLPINGTQQYTAVGKDAGGNVVTIAPTWTVVAGGGAITSGGLFTAGTVPGTFTNTVEATSGSISGTATVTVTSGVLATIVVTPNPVTLAINGTQTFTAVGKDVGGNVVAIAPTWSVAASGGTITSSGLFTAGTVLGTFANTVTATVGGIAGTASVTVIAGPLATITVTPNPVTLPITGTLQYTAVGKDAGGNVVAIAPTWSVAASGGTITSSGLFTAGTVLGTFANTVTATVGGIAGTASVTVIAGPVTTITVTPNPVTLPITGTQQYTAVGKDAGGNVVAIAPTWTVVAGGGAITSAGLFTAGTVLGTFTNTVEASSGSVSGTATVTVTSGVLATIVVTPNPVTLVITGTQQYTAVGKDAGGNVVAIAPTWSVVASMAAAGAITSGGLFTAGTVPGTYTGAIQATSGSISGFATVTVTTGALATIVVTPTPVTLPINGTQQYTAVGKDAGGNVVAIAPSWTVVAGGGAITSAGLFTAGTVPGTFTNTVEASSGSVSGTATVTVTSGVLATIVVTPNPVTLVITGTQQYTAVGKDAGGNVVAVAPTWSVAASGGTITSSGLFTAGTVPGTFTNTVEASSGSVSGTATVTVIAAAQTITFAQPTTPATYGSSFAIAPTASSGLIVTVTPAGGCTLSGGTVTMTSGTTACVLTASQAGNASYAAATTVVRTVAAATLAASVTPNAASKAYGAADPSPLTTGTLAGFLAGDAVTATYSRVAGEAVGTYTISATLSPAGVLGNYSITYNTAAFTIGQAAQTITFGALSGKTYGDAPFTVSATGGASGNAVTFAATGSASVCTVSGTTVTVIGAGTCTVTASQAGNANYAAATDVAQAFTVATRAASVTPNAASKAFGAADPSPLTTGTLSGFLAGDAVTATYSRVAGEAVGTYTISATLSPAGVLSNYSITYNTAAFTVTDPLGTAATFAVLGGSGASSCTGVSTVYGNVGVDPSGTISGFPSPCTVSAPGDGSVHLNDATAAAAQASVTTANATLAGMTCAHDLTGQDLGGKDLAPGVYCYSSTAQLTGTLTLTGSATDVWVFQIGSTLTTAASSKITLAGSAQARNVYWQVGTSATLGASNAPFLGTIIANASIGLGASTSLTGRALAQTGAVTLDTNVITLP
jgi:hypothetical protein